MRTLSSLCLLGLCGAIAVPALAAAQTATASGEIKTAHYRVDLQIGPMEEMFMAADVAAQHLTQGEVTVSGSMAEPKDPATARHLEVHAYSLDTNAVVTDATVSISMTDAAQTVQQVPVAKMYGIAEGPSDTHYGNNFSMPAGRYTIDVTVNGEKASFPVDVPGA